MVERVEARNIGCFKCLFVGARFARRKCLALCNWQFRYEEVCRKVDDGASIPKTRLQSSPLVKTVDYRPSGTEMQMIREFISMNQCYGRSQSLL